MSMFSLLHLLIQKCIQWTHYGGVPFVAPFVPCWWGEDTKSSNDALSAGSSVPRWNLLYFRQRVEMSHNNDFHSSSAPPRICWDWWCGPTAWKQLGQEVLWHMSPRQVATNVMLFCVWNMEMEGKPRRMKSKRDLVFFLISENLQRADNKRYFQNLAIILAFQSCWVFVFFCTRVFNKSS